MFSTRRKERNLERGKKKNPSKKKTILQEANNPPVLITSIHPPPSSPSELITTSTESKRERDRESGRAQKEEFYQHLDCKKQKNETKKRKKVGVSVFFSAFVLEGQKLDRRRSPIAGSFLFSLSALVPLLSSWWKQGARRDIHVERQPLNPGRTQERYRKKEGRRRSLPFCFVCSRPPLFSSFS